MLHWGVFLRDFVVISNKFDYDRLVKPKFVHRAIYAGSPVCACALHSEATPPM